MVATERRWLMLLNLCFSCDKQTNIHSYIQISTCKANSKLSECYIADAELTIHMR